MDTIAEGGNIAEVAAARGVTANAVYIARFRIIRRLTDICSGFVEDEGLPQMTVDMVERMMEKASLLMREKLEEKLEAKRELEEKMAERRKKREEAAAPPPEEDAQGGESPGSEPLAEPREE